jgi:hypothetical protein
MGCKFHGFAVYLRKADRSQTAFESRNLSDVRVEITVYDPEGEQAARMVLPVAGHSEETICTRTLLIHPQLWQSVEGAKVYRVKAWVVADDKVWDTKEFVYPVCAMKCIPGKGFFLNSRPFPLKPVRYRVETDWKEHLERDLDILLELGANCICPEPFPRDGLFYENCLKRGMILWKPVKMKNKMPLFAGEAPALLTGDRIKRRELFYEYQANWSNREVLYICDPVKMPGSPIRASVTAYSNQKKVALYVNGILQEFKQSPPVFVFEDIPAKGEHTVISAQAGENTVSVTWSV